MIKEWICADCVKFKTDACPTCACGYVPNVSCRDVLVDFDYAYEKGRADAIDEFANEIKAIIDKVGTNTPNIDNKIALIRRGIVDELVEQIKEQKNN